MIFDGISPFEIRSTYSAVTLIGTTKASISFGSRRRPTRPSRLWALLCGVGARRQFAISALDQYDTVATSPLMASMQVLRLFLISLKSPL